MNKLIPGMFCIALSFSAYSQTLVRDVDNTGRTAIRTNISLSFSGVETSKIVEADFGVPGKTSIVNSIGIKCYSSNDASVRFYGPNVQDKADGFIIHAGHFSNVDVAADVVRQGETHGGLHMLVKPLSSAQAPRLSVGIGRGSKNIGLATSNCTVTLSGFYVP